MLTAEEGTLSFFVLKSGAPKGCSVNDQDYHPRGKTNGGNYNADQRLKNAQESALFKNFEDVRLTDEERMYLNAAARGDFIAVRNSLEQALRHGGNFNVDCVDFMGRSALHLGVDSENFDVVDILLDELSFESIEDALLHAINKGHTKLVKMIIEHPNFMAEEERIKRMDYNEAFFRSEERSQFSPDITPLVLAAHRNNHEIIEMFLARNHRIEKPHVISCLCAECQVKQNFDSLKRSRSRLNAYRALASPAYVALSNPDPISYTFELRQEMMKLAQVEKEFKNEYLALVDQCMSYACELVDLCRGTQEVEAILGEGDVVGEAEDERRDPLRRLKLAIRYEEKKFVAHPNIQQHLTTLWYGSEMSFLQGLPAYKQTSIMICIIFFLPILCVAHTFAPKSRAAKCMRCPVVRFAIDTVSYGIFIGLLLAVTLQHSQIMFQTDKHANSSEVSPNAPDLSWRSAIVYLNDSTVDAEATVQNLLRGVFRTETQLANPRHWLIITWVLALLQSECKDLYLHGIKDYSYNSFTFLNFIVLSLYLASITLQFIVFRWIRATSSHLNATEVAEEVLNKDNIDILLEMKKCDPDSPLQSQRLHYFVDPDRFDWANNDPEIMADVLFAIANVLSIAKATFVMPAYELLGPLQISFSRMLVEIARFVVLLSLVVCAFTVGITNLYWYYGSHSAIRDQEEFQPSSEPFEDVLHTLYTLFWCMFGQLKLESLPIKTPMQSESKYSDGMPAPNSPTTLVESVGLFLVAIYHVMIIIVLVNMLIAMMSHTFERIEKFTDVEWKFARTKLWLAYVTKAASLPTPFNLIPTPQACASVWNFMKTTLRGQDDDFEDFFADNLAFVKKRRETACFNVKIAVMETSYSVIMQRLVSRFLFKLERLALADERLKDIRRKVMGLAVEKRCETCDEQAIPGRIEEEDESKCDTESTFSDSVLRMRNAGNRRNVDRGDRPNDSPRDDLNRRRFARQATQRRPAFKSHSLTAFNGPPQAASQTTTTSNALQVLTIPQLEGIQRMQKTLDTRLQYLLKQSELMNIASGSHKIKEDIEHVRELIAENQKLVNSFARVVMQAYEQVRILSDNMRRWVSVHTASKPTRTIIIEEKNSQPSGGSIKEDITPPSINNSMNNSMTSSRSSRCSNNEGGATVSRKVSERSERSVKFQTSVSNNN